MFKRCLTLTFSARPLIVRYREIASAQAPERWPTPALRCERGRLRLSGLCWPSRAGCRRPGRGIGAGGGGLGSGSLGPHLPLLLLRLDELAIIRKVEIKKSAARFKMLHERPADGVGGARGEHRHDECRYQRSEDGHRFGHA